jgi:membrane protease YdiL (CAAX protease family)
MLRKKFFNWTPEDAAAWERLRQRGAWRFVLWYGAGLLGGGLLLLGCVVIFLAWPRQGSPDPLFLLVTLAALLVGCMLFGALSGWATWLMEEAVYRTYLRKRIGETKPVEKIDK